MYIRVEYKIIGSLKLIYKGPYSGTINLYPNSTIRNLLEKIEVNSNAYKNNELLIFLNYHIASLDNNLKDGDRVLIAPHLVGG